MRAAWNWLIARRRTVGKVGLAWLLIELLVALAAVSGLKAML